MRLYIIFMLRPRLTMGPQDRWKLVLNLKSSDRNGLSGDIQVRIFCLESHLGGLEDR